MIPEYLQLVQFTTVVRVFFLGPKIWNILPDEIKQQTSLNSFKKSVTKWKPKDCPCRLCKVSANGVGFLS